MEVRGETLAEKSVTLGDAELYSAAYRELPPSAAKLLPYFRLQCSRSRKGAPDTDTTFTFSYTVGEGCGFARKTFADSIRALEQKGFIDIVSAGGLRGAGCSNSRYRLSDRWSSYQGTKKR